MSEILEYIVRVTGGRQAKREAQEAALGLEELQHAEKEAGEEAAKATPKLLVFGRALKSVENNSGGVRSNIFGLSGRIGSLVQIAAAASPAIMGLSGSLIALAGSLAAAAGGAGAIGIGGVGALTVGLGGLIAVASPVIGGLKDIKTAQDAYNLSVKQYGYWSKQAGTAAEHLRAVVAVSGGQPVLAIAQSWTALTKAFRENTAAARHSLIGAIGSGFSGARRLMPAFASATNTGVGAVSRGLTGAFAQLSGPAVQGMILNLGHVFANISGPAIRGITNLFIVFGRVAVAAGPYVEQIADGFARWTGSLRSATSDGGRLDGIVGTLVGHLRSWWDLTKAVGRVFFILLGTGAKSGKGLVDSLTGVVNTFGDWLEKMRRTGQLQKFFRDSAAMTRELFSAAKDLLVPMLKLVHTALPPFVRMLRWLRPVLPELVGMFIAWKIQAWAINGAFRAAATIGRWQKLRTELGKMNFAGLGRRGGRAFGRAFGFAAAAAMSIEIGRGLVSLSDKVGLFGGKKGRKKRANWWDEHVPGMRALRGLSESLGLEQMAQGGLVRSRGAALVGEAGPEILDFPAGARVSPLGAGGMGGDIVLRVNQREIARVTNREIRDQMARGG